MVPVTFDMALVVGCDLCYCPPPPCCPFVPAGFCILEGIAAGWFLLRRGDEVNGVPWDPHHLLHRNVLPWGPIQGVPNPTSATCLTILRWGN